MTDLAQAGTAPLSDDGRPGRAARAALRRAAPALLAYAGTRLLGLVVLAIWGAFADKSPHQLLSARWDSLWYTRIAEEGYGYTVHLPDGAVHSNLAFFPLLPALERVISAIAPLDAADAGLLVSWVTSLFAAWGIFAIGDLLYGRRVGLTLAVLWGVLPVGIVQSMAYSESLFTALAAWGVYAALTRRWLWAGLLAALAGLTRPVGAAVVAALWVAAAVELLPEGRRRQAWRTHRGLLAGVVLAPLGWLGYVAWVAVRTGSVTGYFDVQNGWGNGFDGGLAFAGFIGGLLIKPPFVGGLGLLLGVGALIWLAIRCVRQRQPLPLLAYGGAVLVLALAAKGYFGSKPRLLIPAFPLLLPIAVALARLRPVRTALVLGSAGLASAVYGAFWLHGSGPP
ncbi:glycosyltransferase family 39 protein [Streptomyces antimycoticus]|uniref:Membrane protein n=1 Tax=Streptomyces antimycoticus TaxID=68175 RepID=A0A4D4JYH1_9ACTN|nr:mannosyltransferase family protein [Streptomyces antimycoticus]GDY41725.1 membrane protein [Streptomyces antimycoticus]